jgi:hypothetical protein
VHDEAIIRLAVHLIGFAFKMGRVLLVEFAERFGPVVGIEVVLVQRLLADNGIEVVTALGKPT